MRTVVIGVVASVATGVTAAAKGFTDVDAEDTGVARVVASGVVDDVTSEEDDELGSISVFDALSDEVVEAGIVVAGAED